MYTDNLILIHLPLIVSWSSVLTVVEALAAINLLWLCTLLFVLSVILKFKIKEINLGRDKLVAFGKQPKVTIGISFLITNRIIPFSDDAGGSDHDISEKQIASAPISSLSIILLLSIITFIASSLPFNGLTTLLAYYGFLASSMQLKSYINPTNFWSVAFAFSLLWFLSELVSNVLVSRLIERFEALLIPYIFILLFLCVIFVRLVVDLIR